MLALLLAGGQLSVTPRVLELARAAHLVIAADGGARHAASLSVTVDAWVGDFDSSEELILDAPRLEFDRDKDATDLELALREAKARGATEAVVIGAFGGRFDHALGIALLAARETKNGFPIRLESGFETGWVLVNNLELDLESGQTFSVLALEPCVGLSVSGAKWNLESVALEMGSSLGISNEARGAVNLSLESGCALVLAQSTT
jgi:thiamine pyrophosphokinase